MQIKQAIARLALKALGPQYMSGLNMVAAGLPFTWGLSKDYAAYNNKIVYSALNILIPKLNETSILVSKEVKNRKSFNRYYAKAISNEERRAHLVKALDELDTHPLLDLLATPNDYQTGDELLEAFWFNYELGDGYIYPEMPGEDSRRSGQPIALHCINRSRVEPIRVGETSKYNYVSKYRITLLDGVQIEVLPSQLFHMKKWNPGDEDGKGFSPVRPSEMNISKNNANQVAQGAAFVNGGRGTIFSSDRGISNGERYEKMTAQEMAALKDTMQRDWQGAMNNRKMHYVNGMVNAQNYGDTLAEMQLIDSEKADWRDIFAVFGIPVSLGPTGEALTDNNMSAAYKRLVTNNIIAKLKRFDAKMTQFARAWYGDPSLAVYHDITEFNELTPDYKLLKEIYGDVPFLTPNEKRALFKYDAIEEGFMKEFYIQSGYVPLRSLTEPSEYVQPGEGGDYN